MKILLLVIAALAALLLLVAIVGWFLPENHVANRSRSFAASRTAVWKVIRDVEYASNWRSDVKRVELLADVGGKPGFREHGRHGAVLYAIEEDVAPSRLVTRIADPSLPYSGTWTLELVDTSGGCELTITERGTVKNPIFRFLSNTVFSTTSTMERYLDDLGASLARSDAAPR